MTRWRGPTTRCTRLTTEETTIKFNQLPVTAPYSLSKRRVTRPRLDLSADAYRPYFSEWLPQPGLMAITRLGERLDANAYRIRRLSETRRFL